MKYKFVHVLITALLVFGALVTVQPVFAHSTGTTLVGVVSAVDTVGSTLTVTPKAGGADVILKVDSTTVITRLHKTAALADLQLGDRVEVQYDPSTMLASRVGAELNLVDLTGLVAAVDTVGGTLTVMPKNGGANVVLKVDPTTLIMRNFKPAALADIQLGDLVLAKYNAANMLATRIFAQFYLADLTGLVTAVDTTANTLTVMPKNGAANVVLKVDPTTVIKRSGTPAALADIQPGDMVQAKYNAVTLLAAKISAQPYLADLTGLVQAVDTTANTLTVMPKKGGANVVLKVDTTTVIKRSGTPAALADIQLGDLVFAKYNVVTLLAAKISAQPYLAELTGVVKAIDTAAGTLTVTPKKGGADVVLKVDAATLIKRNGKPAAFADIQLGDFVEAKYNLVTFLAASISAKLNLVDVRGVISAIDTTANTVTVTVSSPFNKNTASTSVVLKVDPTTVIKRNGAAATLADLQLGDRIHAKYNPVTMLAARIDAWENLTQVRGTISAVDTTANTVTITVSFPSNHDHIAASTTIVLKVDPTTVIKRNGAAATLADLQLGDKVQASYNPVTMLAHQIDAEANLAEVRGVISAIDTTANTVTVTIKFPFPRDSFSKDTVLKVDPTTVIKRNGAAATLADLHLGDRVDAKYNPVTMLAAEIDAEANLTEIEGAISAVDTTANTVTITPKKGGADVVLKVDTATVIKRNGKAAALADLKVGDLIQAVYDPATMLAVKIDAEANLVEIEGAISAVDTTANTVTITPKKGGADVVLKVDTATVIKRNGKAAALADLQLGDLVQAVYDQATLLAVKIDAKVNLAEIEGAISAVDTTANTVTVTPKKGGADVILKVDTTTIIKLEDHTAALADLKVGDRIQAEYNQATLLAVKIEAERPSAI